MSQNKCGHCKLVGHNKSNCAKATLDASYFYQRIRDIKEGEASTVKDILSYYFNNLMTVHDLTILMKYVELKLVPFIKKLIEKQKITEQEANFRLKKDRIKVLMWYFWFASKKYQEYRKNPLPTKKLDILAKSFELETDLSSFECPICVDCKPGKERTVTNCNHEVCKTCVDQYLEHQITTLNFPQPRCSLCRTMITTIAFANTDYIDEVSNKYFKVHVLM
jgi:hypothetical protein